MIFLLLKTLSAERKEADRGDERRERGRERPGKRMGRAHTARGGEGACVWGAERSRKERAVSMKEVVGQPAGSVDDDDGRLAGDGA